MMRILIALLVATGLAACTNTQIANNELLDQQAEKAASESNISPEQAITEAAEQISLARDAELDYYAPLHFERARKKLQEAEKFQKRIRRPEDEVAVISAAFAAKQLVASGLENKAVVSQHLAKSLDHKAILEELGTDTVLPKEYAKGVKDLQNLIQEIEGGFLDKAMTEEVEVLAYFAEIESETLKIQHLTKVESMIEKASSIDADKFAQTTFENAETSLDFARSFIDKNYRDRNAVVQVSEEAYNAASHAYFVALEAKKIVGLGEEEAEDYILYVESLLQRINRADQVKNLTSMSLYDQSVALADMIEEASESTIKTAPVTMTSAQDINETSSLQIEEPQVVDQPAESLQ